MRWLELTSGAVAPATAATTRYRDLG